MQRKRLTGRHIYYFLAPVLTVIITLAMVELALAVFFPIPFSIEYNLFFIADPYTGFRIKPKSIGTYQHGIPAIINSHGQRDQEVTLEKPAGVYRILALGDSFAVGANVAQEESYPEVLETLLNSQSDRPVEVINAGVGGWAPFQYAEYFEHYGQYFSPDLILVGFFVGNDTYDTPNSFEQLDMAVLGRRVTREAASSETIELKVFLYEHLNIARLIMNTGRPIQEDFLRKNCADFSKQYLSIQRYRMFHNHGPRNESREKQAQNSVDQIVRIQQLAKRNSMPVAVALIPDENQINTDLQQTLASKEELSQLDFAMPQVMIKDMLAKAGIPVIDLLSPIRNDSRCLYMNDTHFTTEGNALVASILFDRIKNDVISK